MHRPILIDGRWIQAETESTFRPTNPNTAELISDEFPVSSWADCDRALNAATKAFTALRHLPSRQIAEYLECYADRIDGRSAEICQAGFEETGLPVQPRLADVELPRTTNQLRLAAEAARTASWSRPTIDNETGIRSVFGPIGPVAVFGPNNFPFAFGSISGGDFACALAAGNPVIAKANSSHPNTTRLLAEESQLAAEQCDMPPGMVQLLYRTSHSDGERMVADPRLAAVGYTGSRQAGLKLKSVADPLGKPIYLELSSINPVFLLPGSIRERGDEIATELAGSCLLGAGQFCTSPGLIVVFEDADSAKFIDRFVKSVADTSPGVLLSNAVKQSLSSAVATLKNSGAELLCGGSEADDLDGIRYFNTVLKISGEVFLQNPNVFQTEAFGNASLIVTVANVEQACELARRLEGNLTGTLYSDSGNQDDEIYEPIAFEIRQRVGRLLNDKMPTGVAVSPAMNHGGPFPATGHPAFTAVGMPASIIRFSMLQCYDNVRQHRLPEILRD